LVLSGGWRYDLHEWLLDTFVFLGNGRELRQRVVADAALRPGVAVLDVGCGTGTLAITVQRRVGLTGRVVGVDPSAEQIARARAKAAGRTLPTEFQTGVIEQLAFPDGTFDVVPSTLMMHHLPAPLKRQGLAEIARVLKPGGRLVIADFTRKVVLLLGICIIGLHAAGIVALVTMNSSALSLRDPIAILVIGLPVSIAVLKHIG
jgi:ubiquinone/menaquinone biosynthesis C-methylase UbiE